VFGRELHDGLMPKDKRLVLVLLLNGSMVLALAIIAYHAIKLIRDVLVVLRQPGGAG
jgi:hypothetical protein